MNGRQLGQLILAVASAGTLSSVLPSPSARAQAAQPASAAACAASRTWITNPSLPTQDPQNFCGFFQFAWQSFLYLVQPSAGPGSPLNFEDPNQFMPASGVFNNTGTVAPWGQSPPNPCYQQARRAGRRVRVLAPRVTKLNLDGFGTVFGDDTQAGSRGILVDQNKNIVFYEQLMNRTEYTFMTACELYKQQCQKASGAAGLQIPTPSIELKISWKVAPQGDPTASRYHTVQAITQDPQTGQCSGVQTMALVGFHLVSRTPGHPELIWATFEHVDNAPDFPCSSTSQPPPPFAKWSFFNPPCAVPNPPASCSKTNTWPSPAPTTPPISQVCQNYPGGTNNASTAQLVQGLNKGVNGFLPAGSVWLNYKQVGTLWTVGGALPPTAQNEVGSTFLANSTMESFTQTPNPLPVGQSPVNCFGCHSNFAGQGKPAGPEWSISHFVFEAGDTSACSYSTTPPQACSTTQSSPSRARP